MATLTIVFRDMFMLMMHDKGAVVLLPAHRHTAHLYVPGYSVFEFKQHQMNLIDAAGNVLWGHPPAPPGRTHLVHMNDAYGCKTHLNSGLISGAVPSSLNGRVILAGPRSTLEAPEARRYKGARHVQWKFNNAVKPHQQFLTDTLIFRLPLTGALTLRCWKGTTIKDFLISGDKDVEIEIFNRDQPTGTGVPPKADPQYPLREFEVLYDLVRSKCDRPPVPVGNYPGEGEDFTPASLSPRLPPILSEEEPICGGGEGDPPYPPEDPPLP